MKKIFSLIFVFCVLFVVSYGAVKVVTPAVKNFVSEQSYAPSDEDIAAFEKELGERPFYYYKALDYDKQKAYIMLYNAVLKQEPAVNLIVEEKDLLSVFTAVLYDNPQIFWVSLEYTYYDYGNYVEFNPEYTFTADDAGKISNQINAKVAQIVSDAQNCADDVSKELFFNDYICNNCVYDDTLSQTSGNTVYGVFIEGRSVCEGYSKAMQMLLDEIGIYSYLVVGDAISDGEPGPHMWNLIKLDGQNYYVDVTWNDADSEYNPHLYFNVNEEYLSRTHSNIVPAENFCNSTDMNFFVRQKTYVTDFNGFKEYTDITADILSNSVYSVEFQFADEESYRSALDELDGGYEVFYFIEDAVRKSGKNLVTDEIEYSSIDEYRFISINFKEG